jgi:hypothetical protein
MLAAAILLPIGTQDDISMSPGIQSFNHLNRAKIGAGAMWTKRWCFQRNPRGRRTTGHSLREDISGIFLASLRNRLNTRSLIDVDREAVPLADIMSRDSSA